MEILAFVISMLALIVGSVAYLRSGGREDIRAAEKALKNSIEELTALMHQTTEHMLASVRAGYERSIRAIGSMQAQLAELKKVAVEELRSDISALAKTLDALAEQAARELGEVKTTVGQAVVEAEEAMRRAVDEAKARLEVIEAKQQLALARLALAGDNLSHAHSYLASALSHLKNAKARSSRFTESIMAVQRDAQRLLNEAHMKVEMLEALIKQNSRLLAEMSGVQVVEEKTSRAFTAR